MVARYIPTLMAIGAILAAYRLLGVSELFQEFIKKDLQPSYDYIIGKYPVVIYIYIYIHFICLINH